MQDSEPCIKSAGRVSRRWWEFWESRRDLPESKSWTAGRVSGGREKRQREKLALDPTLRLSSCVMSLL